MADQPNFGGQFWLWNGSALQRVLGVLAAGFPNPERATYKNTTHETTGGAHTYRGEPLQEPGTFTIRIQYDSDSETDQLLLDALADPDPRAYERIFPGGNGQRKIEGEAILTSYEVQEQGFEGQQEAILTFQASGAAAPEDVA